MNANNIVFSLVMTAIISAAVWLVVMGATTSAPFDRAHCDHSIEHWMWCQKN